jgi:hypothetical protein
MKYLGGSLENLTPNSYYSILDHDYNRNQVKVMDNRDSYVWIHESYFV